MDTDALLYALLAAGIMLLVGFPVHEFCHAWAAFKLGDSTARWQGRLTLNPQVHFDPVGGLMLLVTAVLTQGTWFFGYAKPTPVNPMNLSGGRRGEAWVAVAGPLSNLVMAAIVAIVFRLIVANAETVLGIATPQVWDTVLSVLFFFVSINVSLFVFNLLPVPPLDGWAALLGVVNPRTHFQLRSLQARYAQFIPIVFLVIIIAGGQFLGRIILPIRDLLLGY